MKNRFMIGICAFTYCIFIIYSYTFTSAGVNLRRCIFIMAGRGLNRFLHNR